MTIVNALGGEVEKHPSVRRGADYLVLDMYVTAQDQTIRIFDDQGGAPGMWPIRMFEVRSPRISSNWGVAIDHYYEDAAALHLGPMAWLRPGFWMDYFDRGWEGAGAEFERGVAEMAAEEGLPPDGRVPDGIWGGP